MRPNRFRPPTRSIFPSSSSAATGWGGKEAEGIPSTANEAQLRQDLLEIAALKPRPKYIFLAGDIVLGIPTYKPGEIFDDKQATHKLSKELNAWRQMLDLFGKDQAIHDLLKDTNWSCLPATTSY